jgi:hypothetical protein
MFKNGHGNAVDHRGEVTTAGLPISPNHRPCTPPAMRPAKLFAATESSLIPASLSLTHLKGDYR